MKRLISILVLSLVCVILNTWAADQVVNLAGTWILDTQKSDAFPHPIQAVGGGAPTMGGSEGNLEAGGGGGGRGGTPASSGEANGGMPSSRRGGGGMPGMGRGPQVAAQNPPMTIEQNGPELKIARTGMFMGKPTPVSENYILDGTEHEQMTQVPGSPDPVKVVVIAKPKKNSVQVRITTYLPKSKGEMKKEFLLSKDGKTLTVKSTTATSTGDMIQDQIYSKGE